MATHDADLKQKFSGTFLPDQLDRKYKNAAKEHIWQWFFPAQSLTKLSDKKSMGSRNRWKSMGLKSMGSGKSMAKSMGSKIDEIDGVRLD